MEELQSIQIVIADRNYQFKIRPHEEELVRLAVRTINERVEKYKRSYPNCDNQSGLAMAILQFAIKLLGMEKNEAPKTIINDLKALDLQLEEYIQNNLEK